MPVSERTFDCAAGQVDQRSCVAGALMSDYEIDERGLVRVHSTNVRGFAAMPIAFGAGA